MTQLIRAFRRTKVRAFRSVMLNVHGQPAEKYSELFIFDYTKSFLLVTPTYAR